MKTHFRVTVAVLVALSMVWIIQAMNPGTNEHSQPTICRSTFTDLTPAAVKTLIDTAKAQIAVTDRRTEMLSDGVLQTRQEFEILTPDDQWIRVSASCSATCPGAGCAPSSGCDDPSKRNCGGGTLCEGSGCGTPSCTRVVTQ